MNSIKGLFISLCLAIPALLVGQLQNYNLTHIGQLTYNPIVNDIWAYVDSAGTEYALIGNYDGISIVSLANPAAPVEVTFIQANPSIWRDIKTYGDHAYAVTEGGGGILIMDLSDLPNSVSHHFDTNMTGSAHNLWIDEQGFLFTVGGGFNGGPLYYDVYTDPDTPIYLGATQPDFYSHDLYVRGDTLWSANINDGFFSVFDVSNKSNPTLLATQQTPRNFCHNVWISDNGQTLFTTDEKSSAWIGSYDVSDLNDIKELDRWRTPNPGVVPHNVHVHNDYLVISYYDDGLVILDGSRPSNLIEVARYDTYPLTPTSQFDGAWGAYPFLPSGRILVSDRQTGLHILEPNYQRACWLEGLVSDSITGQAIINANVTVSGAVPNDYTNIIGNYKTGTAFAGSYQVTFSKLGYIPKTITTTLQNGQLTIENIELVQAPTAPITIEVSDNLSNLSLEAAVIELRGLSVDSTYIGETDQNGQFTQSVLYGSYEVWVGNWGHQTQLTTVGISSPVTLPIFLNPGYKDEFELDLKWSKSITSSEGVWKMQKPHAVPNFLFPLITFDANDIGDKCMTTGAYPEDNQAVIWQDSGRSILSSPMMDLTMSINPSIYFQYHFLSLSTINQTYLEVYLSNGSDTVLVAQYDTVNNQPTWKNSGPLRVLDYLALSDSMQVHFHSINSDLNNNIRSWVDDFYVLDTLGQHIAVDQIEAPENSLQIAPNPFQHSFTISYEHLAGPVDLSVYNLLGQCIESHILKDTSGQISLGEKWEKGHYIIRFGNHTQSVIKY